MSLIKLDEKFLGTELREKVDAKMSVAVEKLHSIQEKSCVGSEYTGWWDYPQIYGFNLVKDVQAYINSLDVAYDLVLVIGIGGSYLGTRAVSSAMQHSYQGLVNSDKPLISFLGHHLSETAMIEVLDLLDERQPIVNVISKSGTTTEPSVAFRVVRKYMEDRFGKDEASKRIIATTDKDKGALRQVSQDLGYKSFVVPDDIGGRYSVLSPVGIVPLALAKIDVEALMEGAHQVFNELKSGDLNNHPVLRYAAARNVAYESDKRIEILSYINPKLFYVVEWWKQLFGESEGKDGKGLFPAGLAYTTDLHSLGQYVQEGVRNLFETFIHFDDASTSHRGAVEQQLKVPVSESNVDQIGYLEGKRINDINYGAMVATKIAHFDGQVPCVEIQAPSLSEKTIGALFAFFETACAVSCLMLDVNPFDQPGVEAYKKNLFGLMGKPGFEDLGQELKTRL
ncbi:glucose-6-phosphate isomerase [Pseudobacteriovorax antillogorgiicola]|uniref:Glucose-6-phosphate isomerase n=1 Tax=Pseudobacteriovorax antillogorgiicola TaxID=1513793 RepID=A0A1Y6BWG7_9BACT|nr:glucose-6-phosphate isomerase [Pseudobacteriovorax antillogorgiicola]TCS50230.1 glucose-6-phosphate isomerase [Pseudobacteriovorax antillogorgiicola]SMF32680.1 glucose-6-phosphate isomerase [Pseudobacteriovorax antillogorgiicola]